VNEDSKPAISLSQLVASGTLDAELAALLWLLGEGGVPVVAAGSLDATTRSAVAAAILGVDPSRGWVVLDADAHRMSLGSISALVRGGAGLGIALAAHDLGEVIARLTEVPDGLPEDAVRRLGVVLVIEGTDRGPRVRAAHYLRPTERDGQGHVQRRPPAVLATWDPETDAYEHFAWGITTELADRVDRSAADLELRQRGRAALLARLAADGGVGSARLGALVGEHLATEPPRERAPQQEPAPPSPFRGGLADPHVH